MSVQYIVYHKRFNTNSSNVRQNCLRNVSERHGGQKEQWSSALYTQLARRFVQQSCAQS